MTWRALPISLTELCIDKTLRCGQSFRWIKSTPDTYSCTLHGRLISLRQDSKNLYYRAHHPSSSPPLHSSNLHNAPLTPPSSNASAIEIKSEEADDKHEDKGVLDIREETEEEAQETEAFLRHYLNLEPNLGELYERWSASDANFRKRAPKFAGIRILRQDAWEALVGFICSSNNNIARISQMMHKLCTNFSPPLATLPSSSTLSEPLTLHSLPPPSALTDPTTESTLRALGFGYRAKYIHQTALLLTEHEPGWLDTLRNPLALAFNFTTNPAATSLPPSPSDIHLPPGGREGYRSAHAALLTLQGVGPKVADCVCLMGLGWGEAVPVDTHVWEIARRDYRFGGGGVKKGSVGLTKALYEGVGDYFRGLWGSEAGWAHSVLFAGEIKVWKKEEEVKVVEKREEVVADVGVKIEGKEEGEGGVKRLRVKKVKKEKEVVKGEVLRVEERLTGGRKRGRGSKEDSREGREEKKPRFGTRWSLRRSVKQS